MKEEVLALIFEYFKMDVLQDWSMGKEMQAEIIKTFTSANAKKLSSWQIYHLLKGTSIEDLRKKVMEYEKDNYKPFPVRLGQHKPKLQMEAAQMDGGKGWTLHRYLLYIVGERKIAGS